MKSKPILIVDSREKTYWDFECDDAFDSVVYEKLDVGDYSIKGMEHLIAIERKASKDELYTNFANKDKKRQIFAEFDRACDYKIKILVVEDTYEDILNPLKYYVNKPRSNGRSINQKSPKMPVAVVTSNLTKLMLEYNVHVIFGGTRAQSIARSILLHAYELHNKGKFIEGESD